MSPLSSDSQVKLPSIKELTIGLPSYEKHARHGSTGSAASTSTSPQQAYYQMNQPQPVIISSAIPSNNGSISSASSIFDNDPLSSRKSSAASSISPPFQASTYTSLPPKSSVSASVQPTPANYIITPNPQPYAIMSPYDQSQQQQQSAYTHRPQHFQPQGYVPHHQYSISYGPLPPQHYSQPHHHPQPPQQHHHHQLPQQQYQEHNNMQTQPKKKRPRRKANEMERLYACNYKNCKNSYGTLNHLNAHITFKRHGPKRKPEEFRQIRELYKIKKNKLEQAAKELKESKEKISNSNNSSDAKIKLLANLNENFFDKDKNEIAELPIFHQQRGYNGYGRHSYTLKEGAEEAKVQIS